jgi:Transposase DDE domain group 1
MVTIQASPASPDDFFNSLLDRRGQGGFRLGSIAAPDGTLGDALADGGTEPCGARRSFGSVDRPCAWSSATEKLLLDMDSSVIPTHGEQEMSVWNGHYVCICHQPLFVLNPFDLERCALRPGNVHSAAGLKDVLVPLVARYRSKVSRLLFPRRCRFCKP